MRSSNSIKLIDAPSRIPSVDMAHQFGWLHSMLSLPPCGLLSLLLAIVVTLWGSGSQLSSYEHHITPAIQVSRAKLWVDTRPPSVAEALRVHVKLRAVSAFSALLAAATPAPATDFSPAEWFASQIEILPAFKSPAPPRSPPGGIRTRT